MGLYRRCSRFVFDAFRRYNSKTTIIPRNPIHANTFSLTPSNSVRSRISQFSSSSPPPLLRNWGFRNVFKNSTQRNNNIPFLDGAKRFYRMDRNTIQESEPFTQKKWSQNPKTVIMVSYGVVMTVYFLNMEIVPYTKRAHFVLLPSSREKRLSDSWFEEIKSKYDEKILPPHHPQNIRAQKVAQNLIKAQKELRKEPQRVVLPHVVSKEETVMRRTRNRMIDLLSELTKTRNRMIDSLNKLGERGPQAADSDGFKWEVIVVKEPIVNAYCMPSGKIVVFSGLLDYFKEDAEVAAILGHEVGHGVARHHAEKFSNNLGILDLISYHTTNIYAKDERKSDQEMLTFNQRMEMEADYIGLLLMASAGYDPRVASRVWERLGNYGSHSVPLDKDELPLLQKYVAIHPCGKERSQILSNPKLMEEALSIYSIEVEAERRLVM